MKLKIERINEKEISTSRGMSTKLGIYCAGKWYGSWKGQWNSGWKVGDIIDIPDDRVTSKESNGKTYWNIAGPPKVNGAAPAAGGGMTPEQVRQMFNALEAIRTDLMLIKQTVDRLVGEDVKEEATQVYGQHAPITDDDIPF